MPAKEARLGYPKDYPLHDGEVWLITLEHAKTGETVKLPLLWALAEIHAKNTPIEDKKE